MAGLPSIWRRIPERYNLLGNRCTNCNSVYFPQRMLCPTCRRKGNLVRHQLSGKGEVFSFTTVHAPPLGFEYEIPYALALLKLEEGPVITAQIVDCLPEEVKIGMKVEMVFRRISEDGKEGIIHYGYAFRPVIEV